jgi:predicted nucleic acid-binding Zn ribbon protein
MYCTKCGASIPANAGTCPSCGARIQGKSASKRSSRTKLVVVSLAALVCVAGVAALLERDVLRTPSSRPRASDANLLESTSSMRPHTWKAQTAGAPMTDMLYLPKADTGFVGNWGGHVRVQPAAGSRQNVVMPVVPMSYYFGEQNGTVFLRTNVYGDPKWPVVKTGVKVLSPRSIEFTIDSVCDSCAPPVRQQEVTRLTLVDQQHLDAHCYTYADFHGDGHAELTYKGTLHLLTPEELAAIDREVASKGALLTKINSKIPVNN